MSRKDVLLRRTNIKKKKKKKIVSYSGHDLNNNLNESEALLPDGSDLVAEEMKFGLGWNSAFTTAK